MKWSFVCCNDKHGYHLHMNFLNKRQFSEKNPIIFNNTIYRTYGSSCPSVFDVGYLLEFLLEKLFYSVEEESEYRKSKENENWFVVKKKLVASENTVFVGQLIVIIDNSLVVWILDLFSIRIDQSDYPLHVQSKNYLDTKPGTNHR